MIFLSIHNLHFSVVLSVHYSHACNHLVRTDHPRYLMIFWFSDSSFSSFFFLFCFFSSSFLVGVWCRASILLFPSHIFAFFLSLILHLHLTFSCPSVWPHFSSLFSVRPLSHCSGCLLIGWLLLCDVRCCAGISQWKVEPSGVNMVEDDMLLFANNFYQLVKICM